MGEVIKNTGNELKNRWMAKMPRFFRMIAYITINILAIATTVNFGVPALGGQLYDWWGDVYTHILTGGLCILATCKVTVAGGYKDIDADKLMHGNVILDHDVDENTDGEQPGA